MEVRKRRIKRNLGHCKHCGDTVESFDRHDYRPCSCGAIAVDGGRDYLRRTFRSWSDFEELTEYYEDGGTVENSSD